MMANDLMLIFTWFLMLVALGAAAFPLVWRGLGKLPDGGLGVSVTAGVVAAGWLVWMLSSWKLVPFRVGSAALGVLLLGGMSLRVVFKYREEMRKFLRQKKRLIFFEGWLLLVSLAGWSLVRGYQPDIQGLEKFMDGGFINSALRSDWMPPPDMWLQGETVNYYYFGHYLSAFLTKLSGIDSAYSYNLMLATVVALSMVGGFSLIYNLLGVFSSGRTLNRRSRRYAFIGALLGAVLLNFGGNLHPVWHFFSRQEKGYWYPDATRFIEYTIHEFPAYSHVVADLHGHLMDLPIVLLFLTFLGGFLSDSTWRRRQARSLRRFGWPLILGFLLGVMYMTNAWDFPIYGLVYGLATALVWWSRRDRRQRRNRFKRLAARLGITGGVSVATALVVSLPFHLNFEQFAKGVALVEARSPLWQLGVLWGGFVVIGCVAFWYFLYQTAQKRSNLFRLDLLVMVMTGVSAWLIVIPEFIYVKDIYIQEYHRANTMFKLTYQSFVMMCLVFGMTLGRILAGVKRKKLKVKSYGALLLLMSVFAAQMSYPRLAIKSYYGLTDYKGLYGLEWMVRSYPDDYQAVRWMKKNVSGQPTVLEAVGESYTDHARVSAFTGLPTVLGWRVHEWLWRGSFDIPGKRTEEVRQMFEAPQSSDAQHYFGQYQVKYVFVGDLERKAYNVDEVGLRSLGEVVYQSGDTVVIEVFQR